MNPKIFRVYRGLFFLDGVCILAGLIILNYIRLDFSISSMIVERGIVGILGLMILFFAYLATIFSIIAHASYKLILRDSSLTESGLLSKKQIIDVTQIVSINRDIYSWMDYLGGNISKKPRLRFLLWFADFLMLLSSFYESRGKGGFFIWGYFPTFSFELNNGKKIYLMHPMNPKLIGALININSKIHVDENLADILPHGIRKKLGIHFSVAEKIGYALWIFFSSILIIMLVALALFILAAILIPESAITW